MFNLRDFIMQGFRDAVGKMADYQVILNAADWQEKGVLTVEDLEELQGIIDLKNTPAPEEPAEDTPVEIPEESVINLEDNQQTE